jgi:DNA repair exonuclease SbcCD nuclease subunit
VFLTHGAVTGIREFRMNEFNELIIPTNTLKEKFDYIALGHYHKHTQLSTNTFYSGSTERFSIAEANDEKGFIELDLKSHRRQKLLKIQTRSMIDIPPIDCENLSIDQIMNKIKTDIRQTNPKEKIIRLRLRNILPHMNRGIDYHSIKILTKDAVHFEIKADVTKDFDIPTSEGLKIDSIAKEFHRFMNKQDISERTTITNLGLKYIQNLETQDVIK